MRTSKKILTLLAVILSVAALGTSKGAAQTIPAADAQEFLGDWNLSVEGTPVAIMIRDAEGQVAADVEAMGVSSEVTEISKVEEDLMLKFLFDIEGEMAPISIRLTPDGTNLNAAFDVADGMFLATATATKQ